MPNPDGLRHAQIGKGVDDGGPDVGFGHLPLEGSGGQAVTQLLQPVHHVLGDAAPVVVAIVLPAGAALGGYLFENTVTGMIVAPGNSTVPRGNGGTGVAVGNGGMAAFGVVGAIGGHLRDFVFDLVKQPGEHFAVAPIGRRHFNADDVLGGLVDGQVDLAPGAALADPVLTDFPFTFAEDLQAGRVHHHVRWPLTRPSGNFHRDLTRTPRHMGVFRYRDTQIFRRANQVSVKIPLRPTAESVCVGIRSGPPGTSQQSSATQNGHPAERHVPRGLSFILVDLATTQMSFLRSYGALLSKPRDFANLLQSYQAIVFCWIK